MSYSYYLNGLPMAMLILSGLATVVGLWLLRSSRRPISYRLRYGLGSIVVQKFRTQTQYGRSVKVLTTLVLNGAMLAMLIWIDTSYRPYCLYYGLSALRDQHLLLGSILTACKYLPCLTLVLAAATLLGNALSPAAFRRKVLFGANKGHYVPMVAIPEADEPSDFYLDAPIDVVDR
jgi:hypothetical protein